MGVPESYFDTSAWDRSARLSGGSRRVPISTPAGDFQVWTRRVGNNPTLKVLLLHGGPGASSVGFEPFDLWFPQAGIEYYHYDQLGSFRSDQPDDPSLWEIDRFVDEVEQVRLALGLDGSNFVLFGHSWGGMLAIEYALAHQEHLKGLVVSSAVSSVPLYRRYMQDVLMPAMDQEALSELLTLEGNGQTGDPRYSALLREHFNSVHMARLAPEDSPESMRRVMTHFNVAVYEHMWGPSELTADPKATLYDWDRSRDLSSITAPTLTVGATHDTMDPAHVRWMAEQVQNGSYLHCSGGHLVQYDDPDTFFPGLIDFLRSL